MCEATIAIWLGPVMTIWAKSTLSVYMLFIDYCATQVSIGRNIQILHRIKSNTYKSERHKEDNDWNSPKKTGCNPCAGQ